MLYYKDFFEDYYPKLILEQNKAKLFNNTLFIADFPWPLFCFLSRSFKFPISGGSNNKTSTLNELEFTFSLLLKIFGFEKEDIKKSFKTKVEDIKLEGKTFDSLKNLRIKSPLAEKPYSFIELTSLVNCIIRYPQDLEKIPVSVLEQLINFLEEKLFIRTVEDAKYKLPDRSLIELNILLSGLIGLRDDLELEMLLMGITEFKKEKELADKS